MAFGGREAKASQALSPGLWWLGLVHGLMSLLRPIYNVMQFSHRISLIPQGLEGRVNAGYRLLAHLPSPLGAALLSATRQG